MTAQQEKDAIRRLAAEAPPLTDAQRAHIRGVFAHAAKRKGPTSSEAQSPARKDAAGEPNPASTPWSGEDIPIHQQPEKRVTDERTP